MRLGSSRQRGFTYVAALFAIAIFGVGLAAVGQSAASTGQQEREARLIHDGIVVVQAIRSYYYASPGAVRSLPKNWDDLLDDKRFVGVRRHLRQVPTDPFIGTSEWGELHDPDGSFVGIYSRSERTPFRTVPITFDQQIIDPASHYNEWKFRFLADEEAK